MAILGHGIDFIETDRIAAMQAKHGEHFLHRVFTPGELAHCLGAKRATEHLAGRFAAKEAILKALGTGWRGGIAWTDMEVLPDPAGKPCVTLTGECAQLANQMGIRHWHLSISHLKAIAMASAIAEN
jgi:holo-[acyl-carrier protein] synthase